MRPVHEEPIEVARQGDPPEQFLLRDRLYVVRAVLAHWVEPGGWRWSGPSRTAAAPVAAVAGARTEETAPPVIHSVPVELAERELWRVEAAAGLGARLQVFDLCHEAATEPPSWTATLVEE
jgi:hypothetical protein